MEQLLHFFEYYGLWGLFLLAFMESFISPILPDLMLIPMVLAAPEEAIYYSAITTLASVLGGLVGYKIGNRFGQPAINKFVPVRYAEKIKQWFGEYGGWAIFFAALAPIPFKFVSIAAGAFRASMPVFLFASVLGRGKRFLLIGILVHYFGPESLDVLNLIPDNWILAGLVLLTIAVLFICYQRYRRQTHK